ncbi:MAG: 50S ribosomal protein L29 [Deltaproteobacteria bacterium]|nr:50S ribosomal protein L29 [Deltaproteobacteria bacterium]
MKYNEIKDMSEKDLLAKDKELRNELFQLSLKGKTAQLEKKHLIRENRRNIARVQTKLTELKNKSES